MNNRWNLPNNINVEVESLWNPDITEIHLGNNKIKIGVAGTLWFTMDGYKMSADIVLIECEHLKTYAVNINGKQYLKRA